MPRVTTNARAKLLNIVQSKELAGIMFSYAPGPMVSGNSKSLEFNLCTSSAELLGFCISTTPPIFLNVTEKDFASYGNEVLLDFDYITEEFILHT